MKPNKIFRKMGLRTKIILVTALTIILTTIISSGFFYARTKIIIFRNLQKRGITISENLSYSAKYGVLTEDQVILNELADGVMKAEDVVYVIIRDDQGKTLVEKSTIRLPKITPLIKPQLLEQRTQITSTTDEAGNLIYNFSTPIVARKVGLAEIGAVEPDIEEQEPAEYITGSVQVGLSLSGVLSRLRSILQVIIILTLIIIGCGVVLSLTFVRIIMKPITQMAKAAARVASGDLSQTVEAESRDEIGQFAQQFNAMTIALKNREEQLENLAKFPAENPFPVLRLGRRGIILYANQAAQLLLDHWGRKIGQLAPDYWCELIDDVLNSNTNEITEIEYGNRFFLFMVAPFAKVGYVNIYGRDVTEQRQAVQALQLSEQRFRAVAETATDVIITANSRSEIIFWNPTAQKVFGYSADEIIGKPLTTIMPERYHDLHLKGLNRVVTTGKTRLAGKVVEFNGLRKDRTEFPLELSIATWSTAEGMFFTAIIRDITERKKIEEELNLRNRAIFDARNGIIITIPKERDNLIVYANPAFERITGYPVQEAFGRDCRFLQADDSDQPGLNEIRQAINQQRDCRVILRNYRKDGTLFWNELSISPVRDEKGQLTHFVGIISDITKRKQAEEELIQKEEKYRDLVETMNEGLNVIDENSIFTYVNNRFAQMLGYPPEQLLGRHITDFLDEHNKRIMQKQITKRRGGHAESYDITWTAKDGRKVYTIVSPKGIYDPQGNFQGSFAVMIDITGRKLVEDEREFLLKTLKLKNEELESILYVASHDLRSALVNIQGFSHELSVGCELVRSALKTTGMVEKMDEKPRLALNHNIPEALSFILTSANKLDSLLSGLLRLSRLGTAAIKVETLDMNAMLADVAATMEYQIKETGATLEIKPSPPCLGDASQINQVFTNLLDNAIKYLDDSRPGVIRISGKIQRNQAIYCIEDNGIGIAPEHQGQIFEAFHQLEPEKKPGEGLGLTIVRRILDRHNGKVSVKSELGKGSKFYISLPCS